MAAAAEQPADAPAPARTAAPPTGSRAAPPQLHLVWLGGNDCPPCVSWRALELPKLQRSPVFAGVQFTHVVKGVKSPLPSAFFLPEAVKPHQAVLAEANNGRGGSPQGALLVDGQVHDYFIGVRSAEEIEAMVTAVREGSPYPFARCLRMADSGRRMCALRPASP